MSLTDPFLDPDSLERANAQSGAGRSADEDIVDFQIRFYSRILTRSPDYVDVLRCQGELLSRKRRRAEALAIDRRLAQLCPSDCIVRYNLACSLALDNRPDDAIEELRQAFAHGYQDIEHLEQDQDLDNLRDHPAFVALLREHRPGND
jgi:tetratricopeptide (TPR) repeat protein